MRGGKDRRTEGGRRKERRGEKREGKRGGGERRKICVVGSGRREEGRGRGGINITYFLYRGRKVSSRQS